MERTLFPICTESLCVNVTIIDDDILETEESLVVSVELSEEAVRNGILLNDSRLEIDILDNDDGEYIYKYKKSFLLNEGDIGMAYYEKQVEQEAAYPIPISLYNCYRTVRHEKRYQEYIAMPLFSCLTVL